ncbi:MAG: FecR domain-containing protein [Pseudomonadota bacterium]
MSERLRYPESGLPEQAAYWFTRLRDDECPVATRKAFQLWLDEDVTHREAYQRVEYAWAAAANLKNEPAMIGLRHAAIRKSVKPRILPRYAYAAAAAVVAAVALFVLNTVEVDNAGDTPRIGLVFSSPEPTQQNSRIIETAIGERSTFELSDGSSVQLNTATKLEVLFSKERREIMLLNGQALFDVAHDATRPFVVFAGDRRITALGTQFEVRLDRKEVAVTLIEGKVEVADLTVAASGQVAQAPQSIELTAGQRVSGDLGQAQTVSDDDLSRAISWRSGRLDFKNEALTDIVYEINRYSISKVRLATPELGELRVSGSFKAGSAENFVSALTAVYPLESANELSVSGAQDLVVYSRGTQR